MPSKEQQCIPFKQLSEAFAPHLEQLSITLRYERFISGESTQGWARLLGPDVVSLTHPDETAHITRQFIKFNSDSGLQLSEREKLLLSISPWVHDLGEINFSDLGVGDVTYDQKGEEDEKEELLVFDRVIAVVDNGAAKDLIQEVYANVVMNRESRLGRMFNAIERIGYLETAIRAYKGVEGEKINNWRGLVGNVLSNQIEKLLLYSKEYPYVQQVLSENAQVIELMLNDVSSEDVPEDKDGDLSYDSEKILGAHKAWMINED